MASASAKPVASGLSEAVGGYAGLLAIGLQPGSAAQNTAYTAALSAADNGIITLGGAALDTAAGRAGLVHELLGRPSRNIPSAQGWRPAGPGAI